MPGPWRSSRAVAALCLVLPLVVSSPVGAQRGVEPETKPLPGPKGWQLRVGPFKMTSPAQGELPLNGPVVVVSSSNGREYNVSERSAHPLRFPFRVTGACEKGDVLTLARLTLTGRESRDSRVFPLSHGKRVLAEGWDGDTLETPYLEPGGRAGDPVSWCNQELDRRASSADERVGALKRGFDFMLDDAYALALNYRCEPEKRRRKIFEDAPDLDGTAGPVARSPVWVRCLPSARAGGPQPRTSSSTKGAPPRHGKALSDQPPIVTELELQPVSDEAAGACADGVRVAFRGAITVAAPVSLRYRYVGSQGYLSEEIALDARHAGRYPTFWSWTFKPRATRALTTPGGVPANTRHEEWLRLEVRDRDFEGAYTPGPGLSNIASFVVTCKGTAASGGLKFKP